MLGVSGGPDQERGEAGLGPAEVVEVSSVAVTEVTAAGLAAAMEADLDPVPRVHVVASAAADVAAGAAAVLVAAVLVAALVAVAGAAALMAVAGAVSGPVLLAVGSAAEVVAAGLAGSAGSGVLVVAGPLRRPLSPGGHGVGPPRPTPLHLLPPPPPSTRRKPQRKVPPEEVDSGSAAAVAAAAAAVSETVPLEGREMPGGARGGSAIHLLTWWRGLCALVVRQCKDGSVECAWQRAV